MTLSYLIYPVVNIERIEEIFDGSMPANLNMTVIHNATRRFRLANDP